MNNNQHLASGAGTAESEGASGGGTAKREAASSAGTARNELDGTAGTVARERASGAGCIGSVSRQHLARNTSSTASESSQYPASCDGAAPWNYEAAGNNIAAGLDATAIVSTEADSSGQRTQLLHMLSNVVSGMVMKAQLLSWKMPPYSRFKRPVREIEQHALRAMELLHELFCEYAKNRKATKIGEDQHQRGRQPAAGGEDDRRNEELAAGGEEIDRKNGSRREAVKEQRFASTSEGILR